MARKAKVLNLKGNINLILPFLFKAYKVLTKFINPVCQMFLNNKLISKNLMDNIKMNNISNNHIIKKSYNNWNQNLKMNYNNSINKLQQIYRLNKK